jgi:hypothetical protein
MKATLLVICVIFYAMADQASVGCFDVWSEGTALIVPKGRIEAGLASPWSYGLSRSREVSSYVLFDALVPGLRIKQQWYAGATWFIASTHSVYSLTPLLRFLRREGTGGIIAPDNAIPVFAGSDNYFFATWKYSDAHLASARVGAKLNYGIGDNTLETIDYFIAYPRIASCFSGYSFDAGIELRGKIWKSFFYMASSDLFLMPGMKGKWEVEQSGSLVWRYKRRLAVSAGVRYTAGEYPFGFDWMVFPLIEVRLGFGAKK